MTTITHEEFIARPPAEVFAFIADPTNDPQWCPPVLAAEQIEGNGPEIGARYRQTVKPGPKELTNTMEITEFQPNRRVAWQGSNGMMAFHGYYEVEAAQGGTRVFMSSTLQAKGIWKLLMPIIGRASRSVAREEFENLTRLLQKEREAGGVRRR